MRAEHPAALKYIFQDEVYLLPGEKVVTPQPVAQLLAETEPETILRQAPDPVKQPELESPETAGRPEYQQPVAETKETPIPETNHRSSAASEPQTPPSAFNYLGANKKAFLIITHYPGHDFMDEAHLTALQNILKRKEVELDDVAIFNLAKTTVNKWGDIYRFFTAKKVLILGENAVPAGLKVPPINELKQAPAASLLYSFSFGEMMNSTDNKKAFWEQMKNL